MSAEPQSFEVVVDKRVENSDEFEKYPKAEAEEEDEDGEPIEPAFYYENLGVPVFTPTMEQFRSFKKFVDKINHYGMQSGIVKIIPPKEWVDSLPPLDEKVREIKIKNPIEQNIAGNSGEFRQMNLEKQRTYNLPQWRALSESSNHQPPARRGERRKGQTQPAPKRTTAKRKSVPLKDADIKLEDGEDSNATKTSPPTPKSPGKPTEDRDLAEGEGKDDYGRQPRRMAVAASTPDPVSDAHGRQPRKKRIYKTAKERAADREIADERDYEGFDYRIQDGDSYTPERCDELEKAYWRTLTYNSPLYGADMPGSLFDENTTSWNVAKLENLLDCLGKKLPGVNTAYLYLGMWKSTFAWHLEDMDLYSINYIHFGAPKQWYSISRKDKDKFESVMKSIYPNDAKKCSEFLRHKTFLVSPSLLAQHGIKVNKLVHHQGEFVITFPFGYHSGYNLGYNCAESVNFATDMWLEYGRIAKKCECVGDSVFVDVEEIERKLRGEPTDDEEEYEYYEYGTAEEDEDGNPVDFPTPPESVEGRSGKTKRSHKRKAEGDMGGMRRVKVKLPKVPAREPCILCPNDILSEPLLPTQNGDQAHRLCAIYTPETYFKWDELTQREIVANIDGIPKARYELKCFFCRAKKGSCFQCSAKKCTRAYHATCAAAAGVLVNMVDVSIIGDDGKSYPQTNIDYRCRFHRPKRPKDMNAERLEQDPLVRAFAKSLIKDDLIQMQYLHGDIFAGVVMENRKDEGTVLVRTLPRCEVLEVEWKWILSQDPYKTDFPDAITTAPLFPDPNYRPMGRAQPAKRNLPLPDDIFGPGLQWGEHFVETISTNPDQVPTNADQHFWYYLGSQSTDSIAKYTETPSKLVANEAADFIPRKKPKSKPTPAIKREPTHSNLYGFPQYSPTQYNQHYAQYNGYQPGYRPQFHGASPTLYAPVQRSPTTPAYHHHAAPMAQMYHSHRSPFSSNGPVAPMMHTYRPTPIVSPITPVPPQQIVPQLSQQTVVDVSPVQQTTTTTKVPLADITAALAKLAAKKAGIAA